MAQSRHQVQQRRELEKAFSLSRNHAGGWCLPLGPLGTWKLESQNSEEEALRDAAAGRKSQGITSRGLKVKEIDYSQGPDCSIRIDSIRHPPILVVQAGGRPQAPVNSR